VKPLLEVEGLCMDFGGLRAVDGVSLEVRPGEIVALIGPNGAGKTTLFNCVTGHYRPTAGRITLHPPGGASRRLEGLPPHRVTAAGVARTFQNIRLFPQMTALENVMVGRHCRTTSGLLGALRRGAATRAEERQTVERSFRLLEQVGLVRYAEEFAKNLPYGAQRRLEIARALAAEPRLLLLDEPAAGLNPHETEELDALIGRLRAEAGVAILLIEHDMRLVMAISDRVCVMEHGRLIAAGTPAEVRADRRVIEAYLGEESDA
jgi:branched-chain amino acid transport system ATP-binding protein